MFVRAVAPSAAESIPGDTWLNGDGVFHDRVGPGILLDGYVVTLDGYRPIIPWNQSEVQPLSDALARAEEAYEEALSCCTVMACAYTPGSTSILSTANTWYTLQSVTIDNPTGQPIALSAAARLFIQSSPVVVLWEIYREQSGNSGQVYFDFGNNETGNALERIEAALTDEPQPNIGVTYLWRVRANVDAPNSLANQRNLMALEVGY